MLLLHKTHHLMGDFHKFKITVSIKDKKMGQEEEEEDRQEQTFSQQIPEYLILLTIHSNNSNRIINSNKTEETITTRNRNSIKQKGKPAKMKRFSPKRKEMMRISMKTTNLIKYFQMEEAEEEETSQQEEIILKREGQ